MRKLFVVLMLVLTALLVASCRPAPPPVDGGSIKVQGASSFWTPDDFPLLVLIDDSMSVEHRTAALLTALEWNAEVGETVFEPIPWDFDHAELPRDYGIVAVTIRELGNSPLTGAEMHGLHRGSYHGNTRHKRAAMIWYDDDLSSDLYVIVMKHELGHALTLNHDNNTSSIMHPNVASLAGPVYTMPEDLDRIRAMVHGTVAYDHSPIRRQRFVVRIAGQRL